MPAQVREASPRIARSTRTPARICTAIRGALLLSLAISASAAAQLDDDEVWLDGPPYDPASTQPGSDRVVPNVAVGGNGRIIVAWQASTTSWDIYARVFEADGTAVGNPFLVNTTTTDAQTAPRVAAAPDGTFTVVWVHAFDPARDGDARGASVYSIRSRT